MLDPFSFNILISDIEEWLMKFTDNPNLEGIIYIWVDSVNMQKKLR